MAVKRTRLDPSRMSSAALYQRCRTLVAALRFRHGRSFPEREVLLDELDACLLELQMRGEQLRLL